MGSSPDDDSNPLEYRSSPGDGTKDEEEVAKVQSCNLNLDQDLIVTQRLLQDVRSTKVYGVRAACGIHRHLKCLITLPDALHSSYGHRCLRSKYFFSCHCLSKPRQMNHAIVP